MTALLFVPAFGAPASGGTQEVFVSQAGSDTTGTGTLASPFATIARALREMPAMFAQDRYFLVSVIPPYSGPGFSLQVGAAQANESSISQIGISAYYDPNLAGVSDPRFTNVLGPVTASAGGSFGSNMVRYTVPTGVITSAHIGLLARAFRAGSEVGRGIISHIRAGGTDQVSLSTTRTDAQPWTPQAGDEIYVSDLSVELTSDIRVEGAGSTIPRLIGIKVTGASTALNVAKSTVRAYMCRFLRSSTSNAVYVGPYAQLETFYGNTFPWLDSAEALLTTMSGGHVQSTFGVNSYALRTNGHCNLTGWLIDGNLQGLSGGQIIFNHGTFRGRIYAVSCLISFATGAILLGREDVPIAAPGLLLESSQMTQAVGDNNSTIYFNPPGYAAAQPALQLRRSVAGNTIRIDGPEGAAVLAGPVINCESFSEAKVAAGDVTGPAGQDVSAGATFASFAGVPIVDAPTLTRVVA